MRRQTKAYRMGRSGRIINHTPALSPFWAGESLCRDRRTIQKLDISRGKRGGNTLAFKMAHLDPARNADLELTLSSPLFRSLASLINAKAVGFLKGFDFFRRWRNVAEAAGDKVGGKRSEGIRHHQSV